MENTVTVRARPPKIGSAYYLPKNIFRATVAFCLSYLDLKRQLDTFTGTHSPVQDGMPRGSELSDPTAREAQRLAKIEWKISVIEGKTKQCAGDVLYPYMIRAVTEEVGFATLQAEGIPLNRNQYTTLRRKIYYEVAKEI